MLSVSKPEESTAERGYAPDDEYKVPPTGQNKDWHLQEEEEESDSRPTKPIM